MIWNQKGFDAEVIMPILKIRKQDHSERQEQEAILELYMQALGMVALRLEASGAILSMRTSHRRGRASGEADGRWPG